MFAVLLTLIVDGEVLEHRLSLHRFDTERACLQHVEDTEALRTILRLRLEQNTGRSAEVRARCMNVTSREV